jgi:hypothetical protein
MTTYCGCALLSVIVKATGVVEPLEGRIVREEAVREDGGETLGIGLL